MRSKTGVATEGAPIGCRKCIDFVARFEAGCTLADREAIVVEEPKSRCDGGKIVLCGAVSAAARPAIDLRYGADRSGLPLSGLTLSADQPAAHRDMRYLRRGSPWALG